MAVLPIIRMGHPTLRKKAVPWPVNQIDTDSFRALVDDMRDTLHAAGGIGLAAPQVNISSRIAVIEIVNTSTRYGEIEPMPFSVFVNPEIRVINPEAAGYWEGCLSVPGLMGYVERPQHIEVSALNESGEPVSLTLTGFLATVFQHEFDHLDGRLYVDRMTDPTRFSFEDEYRSFIASE